MKQRKNINPVVNETISEFGEVTVVCKLQEVLDNVGISLYELSDLTGIRYASLNELKNGKKVTLNLQHLLAIMIALRVQSFDALFELQFNEGDEQERFEEESFNIHEKQTGLPDYVLARKEENKQKVKEWKQEYKKALE